MSADKRPATFSEVVPGPNVVVQFEDGSIARLDQVDEVLSIGADDDEEVYIVYMCRGRMTCVHFLDEPEGFGALLADASGVLAMQWPYLKDNQRASLVRQMGTAVASSTRAAASSTAARRSCTPSASVGRTRCISSPDSAPRS